MYKIIAPNKAYNGTVANIVFVNGEAVAERVPTYFYRAGYTVEKIKDKPKSEKQ